MLQATSRGVYEGYIVSSTVQYSRVVGWRQVSVGVARQWAATGAQYLPFTCAPIRPPVGTALCALPCHLLCTCLTFTQTCHVIT